MSAPAVAAPSPPVTAAAVRALVAPPLATLTHVASLGAAFAALMVLTRNIWFFADDWEFLARRRGTPVGIWAPHNEHWSTMPLLVYRGLYDLVGLRSYLPSMAVLLGLHVVLAHLLWRLMRRCGADDWIATALAAMFLLLGAGWECLVFPFAMNFTGALLFGLVAVLLVDHDGRLGARDLLAWVVGSVALAWSGVALTMVAVMGITVLLRRGVRDAALAVSVPTLVFAAWFLAVGHGSASTTPPTASQLLGVPTFVWTGFTHAVEGVTGLPGAGPVLLLGLLVLLLRHPRGRRHRSAAVAAGLGAVVFMTLTGVGRIALGMGAADPSRYVYVLCALLLPVTGMVLTRLGRSSAAAFAVVLVAIGAATVQGAGQLVAAARDRVALLSPAEHQILAAVRLVESGAPLIAGPYARPEPLYSFDMNLGVMRRLVSEGAFGTVSEQPPLSRLGAALQLQVVAGPGPVSTVRDGPAPVLTGAPAGQGGSGCVQLHAPGPLRVRLRFSAPAAVSLTPSAAGDLGVALATGADPDLLSPVRTFPLPAGRATVLSVAAADAAPVLTLPAGDDLVCGVRAQA